MKIAVSSVGKELDSEVSNVFGRCQYFVIVEIENKKITKTEVIENTSAKQMGGAGVQAAKIVAEKGVEVVITKNIGPRASSILRQFEIKAFRGNGTVREAIENFLEGKLEKI